MPVAAEATPAKTTVGTKAQEASESIMATSTVQASSPSPSKPHAETAKSDATGAALAASLAAATTAGAGARKI